MLLLPIRAAWAQPAMFTLPIQPACVSSPFGPRAGGGPKASHDHTGIDLPGPAGTLVHATADGTVAAIHRRGARGLEVELRHANGWVTRYDHLGSVAPALATGKRKIARGETLGRIGRSGVTYGTHLHSPAGEPRAREPGPMAPWSRMALPVPLDRWSCGGDAMAPAGGAGIE